MLLLLLTAAQASEAVTQATLAERLRTLTRLNTGGVVLVAEGEADRAALTALATAGSIPQLAMLTATSARPEEAAQAAAQAANVRCAVVLANPVVGMWRVTALGECAGVFAAAPLAELPASVAAVAPQVAVAAAPAGATEPLIAELVAMSGPARKARLAAELGTATDPDRLAALGQSLSVASQLDRHGRTDPSIVRLFLRAALSGDAGTRAAAVAAAVANGDPPMIGAAPPPTAATPTAAAPVPIPQPPPAAKPTDPEKLRAYKQRHLVRGALQFTVGASTQYGGYVKSVNTWGVSDGGGAPFGANDFAALVGDEATASRLRSEIQRAKGTAAGMWVATGALTVTAVVALASQQDHTLYDSDDGAYRDNTGNIVVFGLASSGALMTGLFAGLNPWWAQSRQQYIYRYYDPAAADRLIGGYNARLRAELGLTEAEVQGIDLQTRAPAARFDLALAPTGLVLRGTF